MKTMAEVLARIAAGAIGNRPDTERPDTENPYRDDYKPSAPTARFWGPLAYRRPE